MLDEKECFFKVAESLKKYRRAELKNEDGKSVLDDMYVDLLEGDLVLNKCLLDNTTYLIGRKGTGKSTIFLKLEEEYRKRKGYFPCYIDAKTIFESSKSQSIGMDDVILQPMDKTTVDKYLVAREFIGEVLSRIYVEIDNQRKTVFQKIKNSIIGDKNEKLKNEIDNLKRSIKENKEIREITLPGIIQVKKTVEKSNGETQKKEGNIGVNADVCSLPKVAAKAAVMDEWMCENTNNIEKEFSENLLRVFEVKKVIESLQNILNNIGISHLVIMLDDVSEIDDSALKMFIDTIVAPLNNWSNEFIKFKIAFYPNRVYNGKIDPGKIDIINLDFYNLYSEFDVNKMEENAAGFTKRLLDNRFKYYNIDLLDFIDDKMSANEVYSLFFKTSMNVPRIIGYLLSYLHQSNVIYDKKIGKLDIENAAMKYYEKNIEAFFDASTYCLLSLEEKRDVEQLNKLKNAIVEKAKGIKRQILSGELLGEYSKMFPCSSHFHVLQEEGKYLASLELNHFISKYEELSNKDGKKVNVYCLNYGLAKKNNIIWGKPSGGEYSKYFVGRPFNYSSLILNQLRELKKIHCTNEQCGRIFSEQDLTGLEFTKFKCPNCNGKVIVETIIDDEFLDDEDNIGQLRKLTVNELKIVIELNDKNDYVFAKDLAGEVDMSPKSIGWVAKKLANDHIVERKKKGQLYGYILTDYGRSYCKKECHD